MNDHVLFIGWYDLMLALGRLPIEAQIFQAWYFAKHPEKLHEGSDLSAYVRFFPGLRAFNRATQKEMLRSMIARSRADEELMSDPRTDQAPLIL